jgi:hypothetical protein
MTLPMYQNTLEGVAITPNVPTEYIDVGVGVGFDVAEYPKKLPTENSSSLQLQKKSGRPKITPTCQVIGCNADISELRTYYKRYHICTDHCSASSIPVSLLTPRQAQPFLTSHSTNNNPPVTQVRFCQQCGSFHSLDKFEGKRKSCRNALLKVKERHKIRELEKTTNSQLGEEQQQSKKKRGKKHYDEVTDSSDDSASEKLNGLNYIWNVQKGNSRNNSSSCIQQNKSNVQHSACYTDDDHDDGSHDGYNQHHHIIQQTEFMDLFGHSMSSYTEPYLDTFLFDDVDGLFAEDRVGNFVPILAAPLQPKTSTIPPKVFRGAPIDFPQGDYHDAAHLLPAIETAFPGWVKL